MDIHNRPATVVQIAVPGPSRTPFWQTLTSCLGLGPMPLTKVVTCHHFVDEASYLDADRAPAELSNGEEDARTRVEASADSWIEKKAKSAIEPEVAKIKGLHAEIGYLDYKITAVPQRRIVGPNGESLTADAAQTTHDSAVEKLQTDTNAGDVRNRRVDAGTKRKLTVFLGLDVVVLAFLLLRYFNVNFMNFWATPGGIVKAASALIFGVFGTMLVAFGMKILGRRHRCYRNVKGGWSIPRGARIVLGIELSIGALVIAALAGAMAWRFVIDGPQDDVVLTVLMAALFALVVGATAYLAYMTEFSDGSATTEVIDTLAGQLHGTDAVVDDLKNKRELDTVEAGRRLDALDRVIQSTRSTAIRQVKRSSTDRAIRFARSVHHRNGHDGALPEPRLNFSSLDLAAKQAAERRTVQTAIESREHSGPGGPDTILAVAS